MPKAPVTGGVGLVPNMGTGDALSEPNIPVAPPKAGVACAFVTVPTFVPNVGGGLFVMSKLEGVIVLVEMLPKVGALVVCVVEPNNGVAASNAPVPCVPKDAEGFVCPKIDVPLLNTDDVDVVDVELALENKLEPAVPSRQAAVVVGAKIDDSVVLLNRLAVGATPDGAAKTGWLELKIPVVEVVLDVAAKMDVVGAPNCAGVVVGAPNTGIALLLIVLKPAVVLAVPVTGAEAVLAVEVLQAPKTNRGLLDAAAAVEAIDVPNENVDVVANAKAGMVVVVVVAFVLNELLALISVGVLDVKLKDLVACGNAIA